MCKTPKLKVIKFQLVPISVPRFHVVSITISLNTKLLRVYNDL